MKKPDRALDFSTSNSNIKYVAVPEQFLKNTHYFQIYEDGRPLAGLVFQDEKLARIRLKGLICELNESSGGWYRVEGRSRHAFRVRNILGVSKVYGDGTAVHVTYVIRRVQVSLGLA